MMAGFEPVRFLGGSDSKLPHTVRITPDGKKVSIIDIIMVVSFTDDNGKLTPSARTNSLTCLNRLCSDHPEVSSLRGNFKFPGQGQRETPVTGRKGILQIIALLRGKRAAKYRERTAQLVEQYIDADMGLADDITDRAWDNAVRDAQGASERPQPAEEGTELHKRIKSRDSTKALGAALKEKGVHQACYGYMNGGVNQAVAGMPTKIYRQVQVNLKPKEAAREAFTECMLGMTSLVNTKVANNLGEGKTLPSQVLFIKERCAKAAELLGLHEEAKVVQERRHINSNKRLMAEALTADKRARLDQAQAVPALA
ncbi:hypothetical protein WJX74_005350 [Apatococcus lobatus]|uniref:Uncharacterized protein n=2 Tax=Apatococcus TaxID=904362 RepID=A0AAW1T5M9_9CHLO